MTRWEDVASCFTSAPGSSLGHRISFVPAVKSDAHSAQPDVDLIPLNDPVEMPAAPHSLGDRHQQPAVALAKKKRELFNEQELSLKWNDVRKVGCGLHNLGNTCFMNSVLQCLTHTAPLAELLLGPKEMGRNPRDAVSITQQHIRKAFNSGVLQPRGHVETLRTINKRFRVGRQEDAHEYLRCLLDAMHESCLAHIKPKPPAEIANTTFVARIFGGRLRSQIRCETVDYESNTYDPFMDLSLEINKAPTLERALRHFTMPEHLDGENRYRCPKNNKLVPAVKQITIEDAPNVLTIHLKRFEYGMFGSKITRKVEFDPVLDIAPYMSNKKCGPQVYDLYGVLVHAGHSVHSGHYYSFVRAPNGLWHICDDSRVAQMGERHVLGQQAYILFYVRRHPRHGITTAAAQSAIASSLGLPVKNNLSHSVNVNAGLSPCDKPAVSAADSKPAKRAKLVDKASTEAQETKPLQVLPNGAHNIAVPKLKSLPTLPSVRPLAAKHVNASEAHLVKQPAVQQQPMEQQHKSLPEQIASSSLVKPEMGAPQPTTHPSKHVSESSDHHRLSSPSESSLLPRKRSGVDMLLQLCRFQNSARFSIELMRSRARILRRKAKRSVSQSEEAAGAPADVSSKGCVVKDEGSDKQILKQAGLAAAAVVMPAAASKPGKKPQDPASGEEVQRHAGHATPSNMPVSQHHHDQHKSQQKLDGVSAILQPSARAFIREVTPPPSAKPSSSKPSSEALPAPPAITQTLTLTGADAARFLEASVKPAPKSQGSMVPSAAGSAVPGRWDEADLDLAQQADRLARSMAGPRRKRLDEWDEEYDRGKVKKVKLNKEGGIAQLHKGGNAFVRKFQENKGRPWERDASRGTGSDGRGRGRGRGGLSGGRGRGGGRFGGGRGGRGGGRGGRGR